jgi:hypothetical protein
MCWTRSTTRCRTTQRSVQHKHQARSAMIETQHRRSLRQLKHGERLCTIKEAGRRKEGRGRELTLWNRGLRAIQASTTLECSSLQTPGCQNQMTNRCSFGPRQRASPDPTVTQVVCGVCPGGNVLVTPGIRRENFVKETANLVSKVLDDIEGPDDVKKYKERAASEGIDTREPEPEPEPEPENT